MTINEMTVGQQASFTKTVTETDVYLFAGITGDLNPAHINQVASEQTMFKGRIAHGMLVASLISAVLGTKLPGEGTVYMGQTLKFRRPVFLGNCITATVEVAELNPERHIAILNTTCTNEEGVDVIVGQATVMLK